MAKSSSNPIHISPDVKQSGIKVKHQLTEVKHLRIYMKKTFCPVKYKSAHMKRKPVFVKPLLTEVIYIPGLVKHSRKEVES